MLLFYRYRLFIDFFNNKSKDIGAFVPMIHEPTRKQEMFVKHLCPLPQHIRISLTFDPDLDLWPTDLKINRDHLLIKGYIHTKFEVKPVKRSQVIRCTSYGRPTDRPTDRPTNRPTCATLYAPLFSKGGINI